jgi:hypothetical protein
MEHVTDLGESRSYQRFGYLVKNADGVDVYKIELDSRKYRQDRITERLQERFPQAEGFSLNAITYRTTSDIANEQFKLKEKAIAERAAAKAAAEQLIEDNT